MLIKIATALVATTMLVTALGTPSFAQSRQKDCVGQFSHQTQPYCAN
jgi:hypothetical protein